MAAPDYSLTEMSGPKTRKARPGGCALSFLKLYIYYIKLRGAKRHEYRIYFCLRMSQLREMERVWGLDKILHKTSSQSKSEPKSPPSFAENAKEGWGTRSRFSRFRGLSVLSVKSVAALHLRVSTVSPRSTNACSQAKTRFQPSPWLSAPSGWPAKPE
jgi:hypothetical protein